MSEKSSTQKLKSPLFIASPYQEAKLRRSKECIQEAVHEGFKSASIAFVGSAIPTLVAVRKIPWAKAHINYTGQTLIISAATVAAYFIAADKTLLECARKNSQFQSTIRSV